MCLAFPSHFVFYSNPQDQLLAEVPKLLREEDTISLRRFYELIRRGPGGFYALLPLFEQYIKQTGVEDIRANAETMLKVSQSLWCDETSSFTPVVTPVSVLCGSMPLQI